MNVFPELLIRLLAKAERVAVLTGAGVSRESGLQTFREAQTGLWAQFKPEELATPEAFAKDPQLVWDWYAWRREAVKAARPNPGHIALAAMERKIPKFTLATQNVDGLHRLAGSENVLELHGSIMRVRCSECGLRAEFWEEGGGVPRCESCGGLLRPDVVWFGEPLPADELQQARLAAREAQVFISAGTSGVVYPAAGLPFSAKSVGATVVEINAEPTPFTPSADFSFQGKSGEILPALFNAVWG